MARRYHPYVMRHRGSSAEHDRPAKDGARDTYGVMLWLGPHPSRRGISSVGYGVRDTAVVENPHANAAKSGFDYEARVLAYAAACLLVGAGPFPWNISPTTRIDAINLILKIIAK